MRFSDKENITRDFSINRDKDAATSANSNNAAMNNDENNIRLSNNKLTQSRRKSLGRVPFGERAPLGERVPLGGKDRNMAVPTLSRSQTTIDRTDRTDHNPIGRQRMPMNKFPTMSRASSSLGFVHQSEQKRKEKEQEQQKQEQQQQQQQHDTQIKYSKNTIFNPTQANRSPDLLQHDLDTDSLRKQIIQGQRPKSLPIDSSLPDTFSSNTAKLDSSNIPKRKLINVDPLKRVKSNNSTSNALDDYIQDPSRYQLYQELINDEDSIEQGPVPVHKHSYTSIDGPSPLSEEDLNIFNNKPLRTNRIVNDEFRHDHDNDHSHSDSEMDLNLDLVNIDDTLDENDMDTNKQLDADKELGLNEQDLNDLLDF